MKIRLLTLLLIVPIVFGCNKFDDSNLWNSINSLNNRVERLETICDKMNTNISSLQSIVQALQTNDSVKSVTILPDGEGYTINFVSGKTINIYNGRNGTNGSDGKDGKDGRDGKNGVTPVISVKKDIDGIYYWTVDGEWLIVEGDKVKAVGADGLDGKDGVDGENGSDGTDEMTPKFRIEDSYYSCTLYVPQSAIDNYCCPLKVSEQRDIHPQCCCNGIADDFSEGKPLS